MKISWTEIFQDFLKIYSMFSPALVKALFYVSEILISESDAAIHLMFLGSQISH